MLVFLSWSGERSKAVADAFASWIGDVIQAVEPWISVDMGKGARWSEEIRDKLERSKVGIACLTKENLKSEWINFETGAIAKTKDALVCTLLLDVDGGDVKPPLGQFQPTTRQKKEIHRLCQSINEKVEEYGERPRPDRKLDATFERYWPELEEGLNRIAVEPPSSDPVTRTDPEILREILEIVRGQERRIDQVQKDQTNQLSEFLFESGIGRSLELSKAGLLSGKVAKYLAKKKVGGVLSSDFLRTIEEQLAEDEFARIMAEMEKNRNLYARIKAEMDKREAEGSQDEGEA